ncbi:MAG: hypothetical protein COV74_02625 [Candidatus Omnitrophica bacterium CG11_big_fil_rev_8_21_14_0_20_45_26]|uniref:AI-2E family transporter n=1 Tax=Candidatus Abzuiibacterium crystallinum TaxID=1974748 RepID=A0A2H0LRE5_9BACT|nr:MAG: hypothetical protein COV74_02625 [Candidatus Omnitrophica bacterium CG11_big_fil_rev_8_21_14_0_20_45_26]PIW65583.1 MAG: hypothetical protein COW12_01295 [Candidatus Omnitrophica bacterium CG12_big_fil_rev_8_21_14_0_65_45_16]
MTRDQFISLFFLALLVFVIYEIFQIFSPFFSSIFWGAILAFGFYPVYAWLKQKWKHHDTLAALCMTLFIFCVVIPPVVILFANLAGQAIELYLSISSYVREGGIEQLLDRVRSIHFVQNLETQVFQWEPIKRTATEWILNAAQMVGNFGAQQAGIITKNILLLVLDAFIVFVFVFVFLKDGHQIYKFIYHIAPMEEKNKKHIFNQINETFAAVIRGQLLTSLTQAIVAGFVFWFLGIPLPILLAALTFLTTMIPVVGASAVWVPIVAYLFIHGAYTKAATLFVLGAIAISMVDNILKPALIGEKTKLPYFLLFFGVMGGIAVYGLMGIFIAPVVLSLFFSLVTIYQEKYLS